MSALRFQQEPLNMRDMMLSIETSQRIASVAIGALEERSGEVFSENVELGDREIEDVLPAIQRLFERSRLARARIGAVALNAGPGGFTGLRIAHAAAQLIAESCSVPVAHISAAVVARESAVLSEQIPPTKSAWVALCAKGDGCWMAKASNPHEGRDLPEQVGVRDIHQWPLSAGDDLITDEFVPEGWRGMARDRGNRILPLQPNAHAVLRVGRRMIARGQGVAPERVFPVYPREAEAVRLWRQRHGTG